MIRMNEGDGAFCGPKINGRDEDDLGGSTLESFMAKVKEENDMKKH